MLLSRRRALDPQQSYERIQSPRFRENGPLVVQVIFHQVSESERTKLLCLLEGDPFLALDEGN